MMLKDRSTCRIPGIAALLLAGMMSGYNSPASAAAPTAIVSLGYDSFIDRFTILEEDTTEAIQELYLDLANNLSLRLDPARITFRNRLRYGNQTVDENLAAEFLKGSFNETSAELRGEFRWKHFQDGSDYDFGNDYRQLNAQLKIRRKTGNDLFLTSRSRFESIDYDQRTQFDYDYRYFDTGLDIEKGSYFDNFFRLGAAGGFRQAPDTTELDYARVLTDLEFRIVLDGKRSFTLSVTGDRRDYKDTVRSSYWNIFSYASFRIDDPRRITTTLNLESELALYDAPSSIFFNTSFIRAGLRTAFPVSGIGLSAEPRLARMFCADYPEEEYWEGTITLGLDIMNSEQYWLSMAFEPGYRNYNIDDNNIYSDFYVTRLSLMGSVDAGGGFTANLFVSHDPEKHTRRDDDFSLTLISASISREF